MDNRIRLLYALGVLLLASFAVQAQDPGFSQYFSTPLNLNPAFAGDKQNLTVGLNNRLYTNKNIAAYNVTQISSIIPIEITSVHSGSKTKDDHFTGLGLSLYREATGRSNELNSTAFAATVGHGLQFAFQHFISMGLEASVVYKKNGDNFEWGSQYNEDMGHNPAITPSVDGLYDLNVIFPTVAAGFMYFYKSVPADEHLQKNDFDVYAGVSLYNINKPNQSFFKDQLSQLPMHFKANAGVKYYLNKKMSIYPTLLVTSQNKNYQYNFGSYASYSLAGESKNSKANPSLMAGVWYRYGDSFVSTFGCMLYDFRFAISYDFNTTNLSYKNRGKGATEFSLKYSVPTKNMDKYSRGLMYPAF